MNCVLCTVFYDAKFPNMFYTFLESLYIYGNLDDQTDIVIYTNTRFAEEIRQSHLFSSSIRFEINDSIHTFHDSLAIDVFNFLSPKYEKVIYMDTGVLVSGDISRVFDLCEKDVYRFDSHILLFRVSICGQFDGRFVDIAEGQSDTSLVANCRECDAEMSDKIFYPFGRRVDAMQNRLFRLKDATIEQIIQKTKTYIDTHLMPIIRQTGEALEGNIFMHHLHSGYTDQFIGKIKNICGLVLNPKIRNVMEIGFNSGFSTLLMLMANPRMKITCFDLGLHSYTMPCYEKLRETYGDRLTIHLGDSTQTLPGHNAEYDLIHIDGGHETEVARSDIENSYRLSRPGSVLIMDDYDYTNLHVLWNEYVAKLTLTSLDIQLYKTPHHDIRQR